MDLVQTKTFQKNFQKLPIKIQEIAREQMFLLQDNLLIGKSLEGNLKEYSSLRVGKYPVIRLLCMQLG